MQAAKAEDTDSRGTLVLLFDQKFSKTMRKTITSIKESIDETAWCCNNEGLGVQNAKLKHDCKRNEVAMN